MLRKVNPNILVIATKVQRTMDRGQVIRDDYADICQVIWEYTPPQGADGKPIQSQRLPVLPVKQSTLWDHVFEQGKPPNQFLTEGGALARALAPAIEQFNAILTHVQAFRP